jgi:hypothetical protein
VHLLECAWIILDILNKYWRLWNTINVFTSQVIQDLRCVLYLTSVQTLPNNIKCCESIVAANKPASYQHTTVIISDILCESHIVSIDVIRINLIMNIYIVNESVDVVTADIDVDRSSNRSMNYPLSDWCLQVCSASPVIVSTQLLQDISIAFHDTTQAEKYNYLHKHAIRPVWRTEKNTRPVQVLLTNAKPSKQGIPMNAYHIIIVLVHCF